MQDSLEHIMADIYALEPSLKKDDQVVRALVAELVTAKPTIAIDGVFMRTLKQELLKPTVRVATSQPKIPSSWWMFMTPLAATAVLVLMLIPTEPQPAQPVDSPTMQTELYMEAADIAPDMKRSGGAPSVEEASMMMVGDMPMADEGGLAQDGFAVGMYTYGNVAAGEFVQLSAPGFLVVTNAENTAVIGVSELLLPGSYDVVPVPLQLPITEGVTYLMSLYHDDGNGVFSITSDRLVFDEYGLPLQQPFTPNNPQVQ